MTCGVRSLGPLEGKCVVGDLIQRVFEGLTRFGSDFSLPSVGTDVECNRRMRSFACFASISIAAIG